jgi:hypothetical protein
MTSPTDNQTARTHRRDNSAGAAGDARSPVTASASASEESLNESDDAAWEAEVDRVAEPAGSLEDTLRAILAEIADDVL